MESFQIPGRLYGRLLLLDEDFVPLVQLLLLGLLPPVEGLLLLALLVVVSLSRFLFPVRALLQVLGKLGLHLPAEHHLVRAEAHHALLESYFEIQGDCLLECQFG